MTNIKIMPSENVTDFKHFIDHENYVLSSHGEDNGIHFRIPNNINIVLYQELGNEITCKNYMPNLICNYNFDFSRDKKFEKAFIYREQLFPNLYFWPLRSTIRGSNYVDYPSGVIKCNVPTNKVVCNIDKEYPYGINLEQIVEIIKSIMSDKDKIYIHVLACTTKGKQSIFSAAAKKYKNKKTRNKKTRNKKTRNKKTRKARKK
jgi:predicted SAM-dependent methyltransferase